MSDNDTSLLDRIAGDDSRRSFLQKSAVTAVGASFVGSGVAAAQENTTEGDDGIIDGSLGAMEAVVSVSNYHPQAKFAFVSGVVDWTPNHGQIQNTWFTDYNTRMIRWQNTDQTVPLYVSQDADIGQFDEGLGFVVDEDDDSNQPQLYEMNQEYTLFDDDPRYLSVNFSPVSEEEEDQVLENDGWWEDTGGGA